MRLNLRLLAVALCLLGPALVLARWDFARASGSAAIELPHLPDQIGAWTATSEVTLADNVLSLIEPDGYLMRLYEADERAPIWLYLGVYAGDPDSGTGAHTPEVCYPSQGWEVVASEPVTFSLATSERLRAQQLRFQRAGEREEVVYWFQPSARWPSSAWKEQILRVFDAMANRPEYAFVRLSASSDERFDVDRDLADFAAAIAPAVRTAVESAGRESRTAAAGGRGAPSGRHEGPGAV